MPLPELESFYAPSRDAWRAWLEKHHAQSPGVWLIYYKKGSGKTRVEYDEAVEEALCFGWIDSKPNKIDEYSYKQLFTPRKPKSNWSRLNKERVERLLAAGLMAPAGLRMVELAQANGAWNALDEVEELIIPEDLGAELDRLPPARENFEAFSRSVRRGILEWLLNARRPETRAARAAQIASMAQRNLRAQFDREG